MTSYLSGTNLSSLTFGQPGAVLACASCPKWKNWLKHTKESHLLQNKCRPRERTLSIFRHRSPTYPVFYSGRRQTNHRNRSNSRKIQTNHRRKIIIRIINNLVLKSISRSRVNIILHLMQINFRIKAPTNTIQTTISVYTPFTLRKQNRTSS